MFSVVLWDATADQAALKQIAPVADPHIRTNGNFILAPRLMPRLGAAYAFGPNITQARINAPSLLNFSPYEIEPLDVAAIPSSLPPITDVFDNAPTFIPTEFVSAETSENGAGATRQTVVAWFTDGQVAAVANGEIITLRATAAGALAANVWSNQALNFASALPGGRFACVGARSESPNGFAFRFVPIGGAGTYRPGALMLSASNKIESPRFRRGGLGTWFEFDNDTPPTVDFFASAADPAPTVWLDLIYLGPSAG